MKKRILLITIILALLLSLISVTAYAADEDKIVITIDLSDYAYSVEVAEKHGSGEPTTRTVPASDNTVQFTYSTTKNVSDTITVTLNESAAASSWLANGQTKENGTSYRAAGSTSKYTRATFERMSVKIVVSRKSPACDLTIKPVLAETGYTATVQTSDETKGSVARTEKATSEYELTANALPGYSFDHWFVESTKAEIKENPYTVKLTANEIYTAYFREWKQAFAASDPAGMTTETGVTSATATRKLDDIWTLEAKAGSGDAPNFAYWSCEEDPAYRNTESKFDVTLTEDRHYVAHYIPWQITGLTGIRAGGSSDWATTEKGSRPLIVGTSVKVAVQYTDNGKIPHSWIKLYAGSEAEVKAGTAKLLAQREGEDGERDSAFGERGNAKLTVDPWPADVTQITAYAQTDDCEAHYFTINVQTTSGADGLDLSYLTSPRNCRTSAADPGPYNPDIYGAAAVQNAKTGEMELYVAGIGGVYQYTGTSDTTDFVRMNGMGDLTTAGDNHSLVGAALAVGGNGTESDGVTALILNYQALGGDQGGTTTYELRWYDREADKWERVNHIPSDKTPSSIDKINAALIMASDEVWTDKSYYDGRDWQLHGLSFDHFEKVNFTTAYAVSTNGKTYKWNAAKTGMDDAWIEVDLGGKLLGSRYDGALAVKLTSGGYAIFGKDGQKTAEYPEITPDIFGDVWTKDGVFKAQTDGTSIVETVGFGGDGNVYALIRGAGRNFVVSGKDGQWKLMDTVEAFDVGGTIGAEKRPAVPSRIASLCEGVSLFYGKKGSLYLQTTEYGIDFDSNGGSAVASITGQAWSGFIMPMPTKDGYAFAGWYRDAALTTLYESPVIPASRLTLYAKWRAAGTDRWAEDRQKALDQLEQAKGRLTETDYSEGNWQRVLSECENGKYAIAIAEPQPASSSESDINKAVNETIYAALNHAIDRMNAVPVLRVGDIEVVVSMDAQTLGLGYFIKPTVVTTKKYTQASYVITDEIIKAIKAQYNKDLKGYTTYHESEPAGDYAYMNTGSVASSFYLAQVYWLHQQRATVAEYIRKACELISDNQIEQDSRGKYLGEFDYYNMSGWMYSISNINDEVLPSFPGVGAAGWRMRDGEVMRWQFTVYGYGADLNADNSAWGQASITGDSGDKTQLTHDIAYLREEYKKTNAGTANDPYAGADATLGTSGVYTSVFENVLCDPLATQAELDQAVADLELVATELAERETFWNLASAIRSMGASEAKIAAAEGMFNGFSDAYKRIFELAYPEEFTLLQGVNETTFRPITAVSAEPDTVYGTVNGTMITLGGYRSANETVSLKDQNGSNLTIADGKITIRNVTYTVVDTAVEILPAEVKLSEGAADVKAPEEAKQEVKNVAEAIGSSVTKGETKSEGLASAAASTVVEEAKKKAEESAPAGKEVEVHAETSLNIEVKDYQQDETTNQHVLTLKIEPQVTYTVKEKGTGTVVVEATKPQTIPNSAIKAPVTISVKLPDGMSTENLYIKHYFSDRPGQYEYIKPEITPAAPSGYIATWQQSSFSTIELLSDARSATVSFNGKEVTLTPADKDQPLPKASKEDKIFTGWIFMIKGEDGTTAEIPGGPFMTLTEDLLTALSTAKPEDITATPNFKDKPKDPEPVTPVTPVTPSAPAQLPQNPSAGETLPFTDVNANSWYYSGVKFAYEKGLMNGMGNGTFSPNADTTRGMIVTMLARLEGQNTSGTPWYAASQKWAMDNGISDGTNMTGAITREQLAAILFRYAKQKGYDVSKSVELNGFEDANTVSGYATDAMRWAVASGLIQGSNSKLSPKATASRAQVATILMRFLELYAK